MTPAAERTALVALLRTGAQPWSAYADLVDELGSAIAVLEQERGLLARDDLDAVGAEIAAWEARGIRMLTVLDPDYPGNLRAVHDRPALVFVDGLLQRRDARSVAVVGARMASPEGLSRARVIAQHLVDAGYTVASGLAAGIDTAAHTAAMAHGGRTVAVIGTGVGQCYPPENCQLQRRIATEGAVVSQFWPDSPPKRWAFPMRNAVMSGLAMATVVVEASHTSGSRMQARLALAHGRPVFLPESLLAQEWARDCAARPGTHVVSCAAEITAVIERLTSAGALVA
jgi:DNA processing protein